MNELVEAASRGITKKATALKWGVGIASLAAFSVVGWFAVSGAAALIVLLVLYALVNAAQQYVAPVLEMKFKNMRISAIKSEAAANPIETAQAVYADRQLLLQQSVEADQAYLAEVNLLRQKYADYHKRFPEDPTTESDAEMALHEAAIKKRNDVYAENVQVQRNMAQMIEKMKMKYDAALQSLKASKAGNINIGDVYARLKLETAYDEVMRTSAAASAALTMAQRTSSSSPDFANIAGMAQTHQLAAPQSPLLQGLATINPTQAVPVPIERNKA